MSARTVPLLSGVLLGLCLGLAVPVRAAPAPAVDNERITVWDSAAPLAPASTDFVAIPLAQPGTAVFGHPGEIPGAAGGHTVVIALKDHPQEALPNRSGYPDAFPRPHVVKLFENARVIVWFYRWNPGEPTPMHFHGKDVVVVYEEETVLKSTTPDGRSVTNDNPAGSIRFNRRDRTHTETLLGASGSAVITELK